MELTAATPTDEAVRASGGPPPRVGGWGARRAPREGVPMQLIVVMSSEEIFRGLKHYQRIAKHYLLLASVTERPVVFRRHAEARRSVYADLSELALTMSPLAVVEVSLRAYRELP